MRDGFSGRRRKLSSLVQCLDYSGDRRRRVASEKRAVRLVHCVELGGPGLGDLPCISKVQPRVRFEASAARSNPDGSITGRPP